MITAIISNTPAWVFIVFALVAWRGISAMRQRAVQPGPLMLMALAFLIYGGFSAFQLAGASTPAVAIWLAALAAGGALGALSVRQASVFAGPAGPRQAGSVLPLALILAIFASRYVVGALSAMHPEWLATAEAQFIISSIYGLLSGLMVGRMLRIVVRARALTPRGVFLPVAS